MILYFLWWSSLRWLDIPKTEGDIPISNMISLELYHMILHDILPPEYNNGNNIYYTPSCSFRCHMIPGVEHFAIYIIVLKFFDGMVI